MPISNIGSVMKLGVLSYYRAARIEHSSVALQEIQDRRDMKSVPGGKRLHQYANLYFHARNPMLFRRKAEAPQLCVLRVSIDVLEIDGVVLSDQNAASDYVRFYEPSDWRYLNFDDIYARDWRHPGDAAAYYRHKARKCAEILVPEKVDPEFLLGAYVVDQNAANRLRAKEPGLAIKVEPDMFFR